MGDVCDHCGHRKSLRRFVGRPEARKMVEENRPLSSPKICSNCTRKIAAGAAVRAKKDADKKRAHQSEQDAAQKKLIAIEIGNAVQCGLASAEEYLQQLTQVVHVPDYRRGKGGGFKETKYTIPTVKRVPFHKEHVINMIEFVTRVTVVQLMTASCLCISCCGVSFCCLCVCLHF